MRTKSFFILLIAAALCFYGCTETEYIYVTSDNGSTTGTDGSSGLEEVDDVCTKMTDENFKEYCYENFDADGDGKVSMKEAELVTEIDCSTAEDFTGIECFTNLESFKSQSVKYIDLSRNIQLSHIALSDYDVYYNDETGAPIESLDLSHNINLTELPDFAFYACINLSLVTLPESLVSKGVDTFAGCVNLKAIAFPESTTEIKAYAFSNCASLTEVTLPKNLTRLDNGLFQCCTGLKSVILPENLTEIRTYAFLDCTSLTFFTLPEGLTTIGFGAFCNCSNLTEITLPASLTSIGDMAFCDCTKLTSVTVKATTPPSLGANVFEYSSSYKASATLFVPAESFEAYENSDWVQYFGQILPME